MRYFARYITLVLLACVSYSSFAQITVNSKSYTVEECLEKAKQEEAKGNIREATLFLNSAAFYVWDLKQYDSAISYFQQSIKLNEQLKNISGIAAINNNLGLLYFDKGDYEASISYFNKTLVTRRTMKEKEPVISAMINLSVVYNKLKRYDESIVMLEDALLIAGEIDDKAQMLTAYSSLSEAYDLKGDRKKAAQYFDLYRSLHKAIQSESDAKIQSEVDRIRYQAQLDESEKRNRDLELALKDRMLEETLKELGIVDSANKELLEKTSKYELAVKNMEQQQQIRELEQQKLESDLARARQGRVYFIIGLSLAIALLLVVFYAYRQNRRMNKLLRARNEKIEAQAKALREENKVRTKLLSVISHDLRSPLSSVHLMVQLLKTNTFSPEQSVVYLSKLEQSLNNTFAFLDNLLFWAKSQLNGINPTPEVFNFSKLVEENLALVDAGIKSKDITVSNNVQECEVYVDREITKLVLRNILSNALKFTPAGGKITINAVPKDGMLEVSVADTGIGISKEKQQNMFTTKMSSSNGTKNEPSSGVGLVLAKDFAEKNGGTIWFESEEGKGTTFYFTLVLSRED